MKKAKTEPAPFDDGVTIGVGKAVWNKLVGSKKAGENAMEMGSNAIALALEDENFVPRIAESRDGRKVTIRLKREVHRKLKNLRNDRFLLVPIWLLGEAAILHTLEKTGKINAD